VKQYKDLVQHVLNHGTRRPNRTGIDSISTFHYSYTIDVRDGFPLLTGKKINFDNILFELLWFLSGDNSVEWLHRHGIRFWDPWIENGKYLPEAYGKFWRAYPDEQTISNNIGYQESASPRGNTFDQFRAIVESLSDPNKRDSRRLCLTNWNPPSAWKAKLPPCHLFSIFNVQYDWERVEGLIQDPSCGAIPVFPGPDGKADPSRPPQYDIPKPNLNLEMLQRSCDVPVGVPFNIASYALLLHLVGRLTGLPVRNFAHTLVDVHIYEDQLPGITEYMKRVSDGKIHPLPRLEINGLTSLEELDTLIKDGTTEEIRSHFVLKDYVHESYINIPVAK